MKAVIDTNVVFAGLANRNGAPHKIFQRFFKRQFDWVVSPDVLNEYHSVLTISKKIPAKSVLIFLKLLQDLTVHVDIENKLQICRDRDNDKFLETALVSKADFLVSKNLKHFPRKSYQGIQIVKVSDFLKALEKEYPQ